MSCAAPVAHATFGKGTFRIQVAYSTSTFALVTSDQGTVQSTSGSVTEAVGEHPVAIGAGAVGPPGS